MIISYENGKFGLVDKNNNIIVPYKYDLLYQFKNSFAPYKLNDKYGFIDENGNEIIPPKYEHLSFFDNGFAKYKLNGKFGFIDEKGNELTKALFDFGDIVPIDNHSNNVFWGNKNMIFKNYSIDKEKIKIVL
jgi:hypothetical protein